MTLQRPLYLLLIAVFVSGCANMSAPRHIAAASCNDGRASSICLLDRLQLEYESYSTGAAKSQAASDGLMLASAAIGAIGAAVGSGSELYKSAGAIGLSALGFSTYGNFKTQDRLVREANNRLACARPNLQELLDAAKNKAPLLERLQEHSSDFKAKLSAPKSKALVASLHKDNGASFLSAAKNLVNLQSNTDNALKILNTINSNATRLIIKLQDDVTKQINDESFDIEKSIKVIAAKTKLPTTDASGQAEAFTASNALSAEYVIDTYNAFIHCMAGEENPEEG
ncbi:hypothetical protein [Pseudomonas sp. AA-38]|uniref:hypothetical protein n=1 Tax=Pseudomonas sp. AA-38 TaxID=3028807 RepID=UPI0023F6B0C4|nr:hypothetical protein [Pseudomonas sp. AA-38]